MKKRILAICDLEVLYACNFMQYMSMKKTIPFEVQAFTDTQKLMEAAEKEKIEILLISDKAMNPKIRELPVGQIMILSEGVHDPQLEQFPSIYKYQSSDKVIREVMACYGERSLEEGGGQIQKRPVELIGIYSPLGRVLKTSFALTLGQILARDRAVFYLNLEEYAGFEQLFERVYDSNLSDLIYFMKQRQENLLYRIRQMTETVNNLDYLPPAVSPLDIRSVEFREWDALLDELEFHSSYEVIILDLGNGVDGLFQILGRCSKIYMPVLSDNLSQAKIRQFETLLRLWDAIPVLENIRKLKLPFYNNFGSGKDYVEKLVWSQLGDYVRELLRQEEA